MSASPKERSIVSYTSNPDLKTVLPGWKGTPLDGDRRFINHEFPLELRFSDMLKVVTEKNPQKEQKENNTWRIPVIKDDRFLNDTSDKIVMLGHATVFIQISGIKLLIDPIFGKLPTGKRYSELPISPDKLLNIDYILVSHAHYDHCDKKSIKLLAKNNPKAKILTGLKLDKLISEWVENPIETAGWYQQYRLSDGFEITYLPSRHWANRGLFDKNTTLWGGFLIKKGDKSVYFSGDSGYGSHFATIGELFPNIDVALIGAGAYSPAWFMAANHQSPQDAARAFRDTKARSFIPFHYGTFDLSQEPMGETEEILSKMNVEGKLSGELNLLKLGEVFLV